LKAKVQRNPNSADRPGTVTVHHKDEPSYTVTVPLLQNQFIYVPEFKFFVLDILWCKRALLDVDIAFMFANNDPVTPFEHIPVGYGSLISDSHLTNKPPNASTTVNWSTLTDGSNFSIGYVKYDSPNPDPEYHPSGGGMMKLLNWGGDAVNGQGETVYFDAEAFNGATNIPRYLNLGLYLTWYTHGWAAEPWTVRVTLDCYQNGTMVPHTSMPGQAQVNFKNEGGTLVHHQAFFIELNQTMAHSPNTFMSSFTYAAAIKYDRITHYGQMTETVPGLPKWSPDRALCSNGTEVYSSPLTPGELNRISTAKEEVKKEIFK
jgi:hypothetical protein